MGVRKIAAALLIVVALVLGVGTGPGRAAFSPITEAMKWTIPLYFDTNPDGTSRACTAFYAANELLVNHFVRWDADKGQAVYEVVPGAQYLFTAGHCVILGAQSVRVQRYFWEEPSAVAGSMAGPGFDEGLFIADATVRGHEITWPPAHADLPVLRMDLPQQGETLFIVGYGNGVLQSRKCTAEVGENRDLPLIGLHCDGNIRGGFSGSPIVDMNGAVVGILTHGALYDDNAGYATTIARVVDDIQFLHLPWGSTVKTVEECEGPDCG